MDDEKKNNLHTRPLFVLFSLGWLAENLYFYNKP